MGYRIDFSIDFRNQLIFLIIYVSLKIIKVVVWRFEIIVFKLLSKLFKKTSNKTSYFLRYFVVYINNVVFCIFQLQKATTEERAQAFA